MAGAGLRKPISKAANSMSRCWKKRAALACCPSRKCTSRIGRRIGRASSAMPPNGTMPRKTAPTPCAISLGAKTSPRFIARCAIMRKRHGICSDCAVSRASISASMRRTTPLILEINPNPCLEPQCRFRGGGEAGRNGLCKSHRANPRRPHIAIDRAMSSVAQRACARSDAEDVERLVAETGVFNARRSGGRAQPGRGNAAPMTKANISS